MSCSSSSSSSVCSNSGGARRVRSGGGGAHRSSGFVDFVGRSVGGGLLEGGRTNDIDNNFHNTTKKLTWTSVISDEDESSAGEGERMDRGECFNDEEGGGREKDDDLATNCNNLKNYTSQFSTTKKPTTQNLLTGIQYLINSAILYTREHLKAGGRIDNTAKLVCKSTINRIAHLAPTVLTNTSLPGNHFSEEDLKHFAKKVKTFGASGKRTQEQATAAAAHAADLVSALPTDSIQIWTDGSKLGKGKRGPTGAGAMITSTGTDIPTHLLKYHLGEGTNQLGEIWAIGGALETIKADKCVEDVDIHVFSDSDFAIKCITGIYAAKMHYNIIKHVIALVEYFPKKTIHFHHVAGHAGIPGNETADGLANEGAKYSERELIIHDLPYIAATFGFNHQLISSNCNCSSIDVCSFCNCSKGRSSNFAKKHKKTLRKRGNKRMTNYSSSIDDMEELILPNVFRDSLPIFN